uniref:LD15332p (inferred by orthology to a D. melanogaster protein) n=1 Tax=Strongyloides venezuelensis TaxID=75913 RepID=A0A0K0FDL7_STRVS
MEMKLPPFHGFNMEKSSLFMDIEASVKGLEPTFPYQKDKRITALNGYQFDFDNSVRHHSPSSDDSEKLSAIYSSGFTLNRRVTKNCTHFFNQTNCKRGIFCLYMHDNSHQHLFHEICPDLMKGICTKLHQCKKSHTLFPHQMPVCSHYLNKKCNSKRCTYGFIHVKHSDDTKYCENFNNGLCINGDNCSFRHVYQEHLIKRRAL